MNLAVYDGRLTIAWPREFAEQRSVFADKLRALVVTGLLDEYWVNEEGIGLYRASLHIAHDVEALEKKLERVRVMILNEKANHGAAVAISTGNLLCEGRIFV